MAGIRIRGRIEPIGASRYFVIASTIPEAEDEKAIVLTWTSPNAVDANRERIRLMDEVGKAVRARGDTVVGVED